MEKQAGEAVPGAEDAATHDFSRVRGAVAGLERAIRSFRLHEGQGPTLEEHLAAATTLFTELVASGPLTLRVSSFGLLFGNRPLTGARGIDATWFGLFADSVREVTFQPGLSGEEIRTFVEVLCSEPEDGDDRVTLLWRREVHRIELFLSSLLPARLEPGADGDIRLVSESGSASLFESEQDAPGTPTLAFSRGDPRALVGQQGLSWLARAESQPFAVTPWVEAALRAGGARARGDDVRRFVDALLSARTGTGTDTDSAALLDALIETLLNRDPESRLVPLLSALVEGAPETRALLEPLAHPESMVRLAPLCDLDPEGLEPVVRGLGSVDANGLSALLVELRDPVAQKRFAQLAGEHGGDVVPFYLGQLDSENEREALSAVEALAALDGDRGLPGLARALNSPSDRVRYQSLRSLGGRYHPDLAETLLEVLDDPRRVHRLLALRVLEQSDEPGVAEGVIEAVKRAEFLERDPEEQVRWLACLAAFPQEQTIAVLSHLLGLRSAMRKAIARLQLLVVERLAGMKHARARQILVDARGRWQLARAVRRAISEALEQQGTP